MSNLTSAPSHSSAIEAAIRAMGAIGIIRAADAKTAHALAITLLDAGQTVVEVSLTTPGALEVVAELVRTHPHAIIGAGTVLNVGDAERCLATGARLLVSPTVDRAVIETAHAADAVAVPGAGTVSECVSAMAHGARLVKIFPARAWGPHGLRDVLAALPSLAAVPTGGIVPDDAARWFECGAVALGIGSAFTQPGPVTVAQRVAAVAAARAR